VTVPDLSVALLAAARGALVLPAALVLTTLRRWEHHDVVLVKVAYRLGG
jgi:hypothetical protein